MNNYKILTKYGLKPFYPDVTIDFGRNEVVLLKIKVLTKNKKRYKILEEDAIKILGQLRAEKEYRIHFENPYLIFEYEDGKFKKGGSKIKGTNRNTICIFLLTKPASKYSAYDLLRAINAKRAKYKKRIYKNDDVDIVFNAARKINYIAKKDFGIDDDVIMYFEDSKIVMVNPVFKKKTIST